ncbi:hypothetical protein GGX14DRAFT_414881 [Mycena pura]|uniref:RlpA-like protein double-psi beta-barrel domain-containing protein n=1 Tax=Mycena pura TaxID=153505 RepID=A0AAD7E4T0_9AGAR|nr:hypothetical protein GGX14DRAFT_414881 [Mycena pura]
MSRLASFALFFIFIVSLSVIGSARSIAGTHAIAKSKYTTSHSLGDSYTFDPRDGWQTFNTTNLHYKYPRNSASKSSKPNKPETVVEDVAAAAAALKTLKGIGDTVKVTWYTGQDLLNPSCWSNVNWHPTDESFVCATTLTGWTNKPKCFDFLELCTHPSKCIFVRVVDTCAGCQRGSHHVDLTRAAFGQLAPFDEGVLNVHMRPATQPTSWYEDLWGPKYGDMTN